MTDRSYTYLNFDGPGKARDIVQFYRERGWRISKDRESGSWLGDKEGEGSICIDGAGLDPGRMGIELYISIKGGSMDKATGRPTKAFPLPKGFEETDGSC